MADDTKVPEKVVFLAFTNPNTVPQPQGFDVHACTGCRNKTFLLVCDKAEGFPMMRCACCGQNIGRIGWADPE